MNSRVAVALLLVLAAGTAGGADHLPVSPEASARLERTRVAAVVVALVMQEKGATLKPPVRRPQWEAPARDALTRVLTTELARRGLAVRVVEVPAEREAEIGDVVGILVALRACAGWYGLSGGDNVRVRQPCTPGQPGRRTSPGVGSLAGLSSDVGVDTIVLLAATGTNSTTAQSLFGWLGGVRSPGDSLALAVLTPAGSVDWLSWTGSSTADLREVASAATLVPELLAGIPFPPPVEARP